MGRDGVRKLSCRESLVLHQVHTRIFLSGKYSPSSSPTSFIPPFMFIHFLPWIIVSKISRPFSLQTSALTVAVLFLTVSLSALCIFCLEWSFSMLPLLIKISHIFSFFVLIYFRLLKAWSCLGRVHSHHTKLWLWEGEECSATVQQ